MRVGVGFPFELPLDEARAFVKMVDRSGADSLWVYENPTWPGAFSTAAWVAECTRSVQIGIGTVSPYTRNPVVLAMETAQLQVISGGRLVLGLGAGSQQTLQRWGIDTSRPLTYMTEGLAVQRRLVSGESVDFQGKAFTLQGVQLSFPPTEPVPYFVGSVGPRLVERAGQHADGLIISNHCPLSLLRELVGIARGAARAENRDPEHFRIVAFVPFALRSKARDAVAALKPSLAKTLHRIAGNVALERMYTTGGILGTEEIRSVATGIGAGIPPAELIRDEVVDQFCVAGDSNRVSERVAEYADAGVDELVLFELDADPSASEALREAVDLVRGSAGLRRPQ